ncbi:ester cyclase [Mesobacterium sp. TK19101]|uniref:Ester cyclase n=1 Tax=Mesobacterium hydrothermale TaxID=3111907 RepID=A0ABU6HHM2_9RHOB|nr:ester cyclase [Mesobacterium sp. TK19101]MEC3861325.1 ester cyclase [Mesobacterium sp. TK19101]
MQFTSFTDPAQPIRSAVRTLWDSREFGRTPQRFSDDAVIMDAGEGVMGLRRFASLRQGVLAAFPDFRSEVEDAICVPTDQGILASVRMICTATHGRNGPYGAASQMPLAFRTMLLVEETGGVIRAAWQIRDQGALLRTTGNDPEGWARTHPGQTRTDPMPTLQDGNPWANSYADILRSVMEGDLAILYRGFDPGAELFLPGGHIGSGPEAADVFWLSLRAALPSAEFAITAAIGADDPLCPPRVALHWQLTGVHDGWGLFGAPSGRTLTVQGVSQAEFGPNGLRREWTVLDELAVWQQITAASAAPGQERDRVISFSTCPASG